ncbi:MAG: hypothetical protein JWL77_6855 [Chthonomonadaceae bacterium]|nr:hypothetical protein [Chthonomonadaceae bacterium]
MTRTRHNERGSVTVMVGLLLPLVILVGVFAVDIGNWYVHKRQLQIQADASALAGGTAFQFPCQGSTNTAILAAATDYSGTTHNRFANIPDARHGVFFNSSTYPFQPSSTSPTADPCGAQMLDVKITEKNVPWIFKALGVVPFITSHARVELKVAGGVDGLTPIAIPYPVPPYAYGFFIDESNGTAMAVKDKLTGQSVTTFPLTAPSGPPTNPVQHTSRTLTVDVNTDKIGLRTMMSPTPLTNAQLADPQGTCGTTGTGISCYDGTSANSLYSIRRWPTAAESGATQPVPWVSALRLAQGSCDHPYFSDVPLNASPCRMNLYATVHFNSTVTDQSKQSVTALVAGQTITLSPPTDNNDPTKSTNIWTAMYDPTKVISGANSGVPVASYSGSSAMTLTLDQLTGQVHGTTCKSNNGKTSPCTVTVNDAQRTYGASLDSGSISRVEVDELDPTTGGTNQTFVGSVPACSSSPCNHDFVVSLDVASFHVGTTPGERPTVLRISASQGTGSLRCGGGGSLANDLAYGCNNDFRPAAPHECDGIKTYGALPPNPPNPWPCVEVKPGTVKNAVDQAMMQRIFGGANSCSSPSQDNHWPQYPAIPDKDPRRVTVFITDFGALDLATGQTTVPIVSFAEFYITGWAGQGNECASNDPVPPGGDLVGHFIGAVVPGTPTNQTCDPTKLAVCTPALTQ